jgi:CBS domain-containing protein
MDGYGRDYRGGRGRYDVWYVPDAAPQAGMYPGPWGQGRFSFRRPDGRWYDEEYHGHTGAEGVVYERGRRGYGQGPYEHGGRGGGYEGEPGGYGGGYGPEHGHGGYEGEGGHGRGRSDSDRICAWQIMTEDPHAVTAEATLAEVAKSMRELDVGVIPVVDGDEDRRLVGVITDRDIVVRALADGKDGGAKVGDYMTPGVATVGRNDTVHDVLDVMKRERVRRVPVTDREGRLVGIISQADLAVSYAGLDEHREAEVEEAIERISEPAHPRRGGWPGRTFGVRRAQRGY